MKRPLKNRRPIGPFIHSSSQESEEPQQNSTSVDPESIEDPILQQAEVWFKEISKERNKRKMMKNYMRSISSLSDAEIEEKLDEAGL